ncbi:hypothetical protein ACQ4M3_05210 [Leptolyngbya sp. AN03gr2]|uniref:hypothetical protein n=1 Tax=unclassified Leptolyngbya TaxID=2650499 RepID=UPI003D312BD5
MIYLLHFHDRIHPDRTTQHYVGYSAKLSDRILAHLENRSNVSLINAAHDRGISFTVVRCWKGDRKLERHLKSLKNAPKFSLIAAIDRGNCINPNQRNERGN